MGILSKIFGSGKEKEKGFQQIETELAKLLKKTSAEMIGIIGTGGRLKGLPLIYVSDDEAELKKYSARLNEIIRPIDNISDNDNVLDVTIAYSHFVLFFKQVLTNIGYFTLLDDKSQILAHKEWVYKNVELMKDLFHD